MITRGCCDTVLEMDYHYLSYVIMCNHSRTFVARVQVVYMDCVLNLQTEEC